VALDSAGNLYITDWQNHCIRKVDSNGIISTILAGPTFLPTDIKADSADNLYVTDVGSSRVLKGSGKGVFSALAGTGTPGFSGDAGPAYAAQFNSPTNVAVSSAGDVYILDAGNYRIRKIAHETGLIQTIAGTGTPGFSGDGGPARSAQIYTRYPLYSAGMTVDTFGNLYFSDSRNGRVRRISPGGIITTVAGGGFGVAEDGVAALSALLTEPTGIAIGPLGTLFIADLGRNRIRRVNGAGIMSTVPVVMFQGSPEMAGRRC
jgi:sugar lactone lactonase YvrE